MVATKNIKKNIIEKMVFNVFPINEQFRSFTFDATTKKLLYIFLTKKFENYEFRGKQYFMLEQL